jgi:hypothetical protein
MKPKPDKVAVLDAKIKELESSLNLLKKTFAKTIADLEKRTMLRTPGHEHCRVCAALTAQHKPNPPISRHEEDFCRAGHGVALAEKRRGRKAQRMPLDWEEVLRLAR